MSDAPAAPDPAHEQISELLLLHRIAQRINSQLDPDALLEDIVSDVAQTFGYSRSAILLIDHDAHELVIAAVRGWTANYHQKGERFPLGRYGIVGHVATTGETHYAPDVSTDPYYEVSEPLTRSELDVPLRSRGALMGVFNVQHTALDAFGPARIRLIEALAGHVATAIDNARLFQRERAEKERLLAEQREARGIQQVLFPSGPPPVPGFLLEGVCLPCRAVGGDWYDFVPLPRGRIGIAVADVSGKGMAAALLMSSTRSLLRLLAREDAPPGEILGRLNHILLTDCPTARFVTMVYAVLEPGTKRLTFASAGHLPPLLVAGSAARFVEAPEGMPLGIADGRFSDVTVDMSPGDRFVIYSDGITEASSPTAGEYGQSRVQKLFTAGTVPIARLIEDVRQFSGADILDDDATVVSVTAVSPARRPGEA